MKTRALWLAISAGLLVTPAMHAADWTGTGEFGLALARGNSESETLNARFNFKKETDPWLYEFTGGALRAEGEVIVVNPNTGQTSRIKVSNANRFDLGGKVGYKFDERLYTVGTGRYDQDDFAAFRWQFIGAASLGYRFIQNERTKLFAEIGPGWRRSQPVDIRVLTPPPPVVVIPSTQTSLIGRLAVGFAHNVSDSTSLTSDLVVESGGGDTFAQNDLGLSVAINQRFALKTGLQLRHNSDVSPGIKKTDTLVTTNVVVNF